jgi:hypothetical protein
MRAKLAETSQVTVELTRNPQSTRPIAAAIFGKAYRLNAKKQMTRVCTATHFYSGEPRKISKAPTRNTHSTVDSILSA